MIVYVCSNHMPSFFLLLSIRIILVECYVVEVAQVENEPGFFSIRKKVSFYIFPRRRNPSEDERKEQNDGDSTLLIFTPPFSSSLSNTSHFI